MKVTQRLNIGKMEVDCLVCGKLFHTNNIVSVAYMEDGCEIGNLCDECAELTNEQVRRKIFTQAAMVRQEVEDMLVYADFMDELAKGTIEMPDPGKKEELLKIVKRS